MDSPDPLDQLLRGGPLDPWWERLRSETMKRLPWLVAAAVIVGVVVTVVALRSGTPAAVSLPRAGATPAGGTNAPSTSGGGSGGALGGGGGGGTGPSAPTTVAPTGIVVHVAGAVAAPGLVTLHSGARVADAVAAAGGLRADADGNRINLAAPVVDGVRVYVPAVGEVDLPSALPVAGAPTPGASDDEPSAAAPVDINTATAAQLETLPGVGPSTAAAIIAYRDEHQRFRSVDELQEVRGIGPAKFEALVDLVVAT